MLDIHPSGTLRASLVTQWIPFLFCLGIIVTNKSKPKQLLFLVGTILAGILASISLLLYIGKFQQVTMPYSVGWQVALETLKTKPIHGAGVLNYEHVFTQARPSTLNVSPIWNIRFILGPNVLFHYITIFGFIGAIVCVFWLAGLVISSLKAKQGYLFPVIGIITYFLLFPLDITFLIAGIILTAVITPIFYSKSLSLHQPLALLGTTMILPTLLLIGLIYIYVPAVQTEILTRKVVVYANANDLTSPIPLLDKARNLTPYRDDLYILSSQLQFQLLLQKISENGISDDEKEQIAQQFNGVINLAQQAININPLSSINWKNLADMYSQLRPYISNADVWAAQSLQESFIRDPSNAFIQAQMADILYSQGNIVRAIQILEQAINLKPDYPPFLYALARLYTEMRNYEDAITLLNRIKELLPASAPDVEILNKDLQTLDELIAQRDENTPDQQSQNIAPPIKTTQITPAPTVSLSPQPSPSLSPTPSSPTPETDQNATFPDIPPIIMPTPTP
jgi:Tfp pilus assembly protein PilF